MYACILSPSLTPLTPSLPELAYENALELNPQHMSSLANLCALKRAAGDHDGAKVCMSRLSVLCFTALLGGLERLRVH